MSPASTVIYTETLLIGMEDFGLLPRLKKEGNGPIYDRAEIILGS